MYLNPKYMKIKYGKYEKMRFGAAHTPRRNMVKPIIAAMRESVKYMSCIFFALTKNVLLSPYHKCSVGVRRSKIGRGGLVVKAAAHSGEADRVRFPMGAARGAAAYA